MPIFEVCNIDKETGIHYGCISQNSLDVSVIDDWYNDDLCYDQAHQALDDALENLFNIIGKNEDDHNVDPIREVAESRFNDMWQNDHPEYYFKDNEYEAQYSESLNCWIILKSPYYTLCRPCSPCVPNAGDLDSPDKNNGIKAYCLPREFFDNEYFKSPYKTYFNVSDGVMHDV